MGNVLSLGISVAVPLLGGTAIGISARQDVIDWYVSNKSGYENRVDVEKIRVQHWFSFNNIYNTHDVDCRYPTIKKPSWNPPNWIFGPVWTALYSMMGVAAWRVFKSQGLQSVALGLYALQLGMNFLWTPLFFKQHNLKLASYDITALIGVLTMTIWKFHEVDSVASYLLVPYLGWTGFAACLTWWIHVHNPEQPKAKTG